MIFVFFVLKSQLSLPASISMTSFNSLETVLNLADQLLQIVRLELLIVLFYAVLDILMQLNSLWLGNWQMAHELGVDLLPVRPVVFIALVFQNVRIEI